MIVYLQGSGEGPCDNQSVSYKSKQNHRTDSGLISATLVSLILMGFGCLFPGGV